MNSIVLKVQQGTTKGSGSLCRTCRYAHVVRSVNNQQTVTCHAVNKPRTIGFDVAEWNRYMSATQPSLYEMEEIAWRLVTKQAGRPMGFVNPAEFRRIEEREGRGPNTPPSH